MKSAQPLGDSASDNKTLDNYGSNPTFKQENK